MWKDNTNTGHIKMIPVGTHPSQAGVDSQHANVKLRIYFIHPFKDDFNLTLHPQPKAWV